MTEAGRRVSRYYPDDLTAIPPADAFAIEQEARAAVLDELEAAVRKLAAPPSWRGQRFAAYIVARATVLDLIRAKREQP